LTLAYVWRTDYRRAVAAQNGSAALAYVFWHTAPRDGDIPGYEQALAAFHHALGDAAPSGFVGSAGYAVDGAAWQRPPLYEDWYLLTDWAALGVLNEAAVDARRRGAHDAVAASARGGAGGIYLLCAGDPDPPPGGPAIWLDKPAGVPYPGFRERLARLTAEQGSVWERQLVLGPAPEYCAVTSSGPAGAPVAATVVQRRQVCRHRCA
jgi:hypothetical protein